MAEKCENVNIWPTMGARIKGDHECTPPFKKRLIECDKAFLIVPSPSIEFFDWFHQNWKSAKAGACWNLIVSANPAAGTREIVRILPELYSLHSVSDGRLKIRILTPGKINGIPPRMSVSVLKNNGQLSISIGTSPSFGIGLLAGV